MFRYHPTFKFIQMHKNLSDAIEKGSDLYRLKTEDGVEVRKLYIKLLDSSVQCDEVKFLLSVYGDIEAINIFGKDGGWRLRNRGFVTFARASDASCALINRNKFDELFALSPADTWIQPDYQQLHEKAFSNVEDLPDKSESQLLAILNDDCLLHVLAFLDVLDVIAVRKVCQKFAELGGIHFRTVKSLNFANIKAKKKLTLHEAKLVLETVGHNVVKASINSEKFHNRRFLNFIPKYLTNLKHLNLSGFKLESYSFWDRMAKVLSKLETLDLSDNSEINENFLKSFKKSPSKLIALNVSNCTINGNFLKLLPSLQILNISGCRYINGKQLNLFVDMNKNLRILNISKCPNMFGKDVNDLLLKVPQLEVLSLNNYYIDDETSKFVIPSINPLQNLKELTIQNINYPPCDQLLRTINLQNRIEVLNISYGNLTLTSVYAISTMKLLRKLIMNFKNSVSEDIVDYLMELENLEEVHISGSSYIAPANILRLLLLPKMKFLDISRCYGFTNEFIIEAFKCLKEMNLARIFRMHIGQTEIDKSVFNLPQMKGARDMLLLNWEATKDVEHDYDIDEENKYEMKKIADEENNKTDDEYFTIDDIINILSNIDDCDPKLVATIKRNL